MPRRLAFVLLLLASGLHADETVTWRGLERTYLLHVPSKLPDQPVPLLVALHGSGRTAGSVLNPWKGLANTHGFIVAAPNSLESEQWQGPHDGPGFLHRVVEDVRRSHRIDTRRIYLFGHSAGAHFALIMACVQSEYFAAVATHAGTLAAQHQPYTKALVRRIPIGLWVGDRDTDVPVSMVRSTKEYLESKGVPVELHVVPRHDHTYTAAARRVNREMWEFFAKHPHEKDAKYDEYGDD